MAKEMPYEEVNGMQVGIFGTATFTVSDNLAT